VSVAVAVERRGLFRRRHPVQTTRRPIRALTAAATRMNLTDEQAGERSQALRQGWQSQAWDYRDQVGELRYAIEFLANGTSRMRLFPAAYPTTGETDNPVPLGDVDGAPQELIDLANEAVANLGHGRLALSRMLAALSTNQSVAGECWLLGMEDQQGEEHWSIRSVDEILVEDDQWMLRELPTGPQGVIPWVPIDPDTSYLARIWRPHPRFSLIADSPLRAMLDDCESLMILRRMIRATGRSRLAGRGLLLMPEELTIKSALGQNFDEDEADPFLDDLTTAMVTPISDEGVASAVVPIVIRGPADQLDKVRHIDFASQFDDAASKTRMELLGIIATTFDLPKEIIEGSADLNHWSAWQVDANTFRHHMEPHVILCCDGLTAAYLRVYIREHASDELLASGWIDRTVLWYDPVEIVTNPDQTQDAKDLYDRHAISAAALARTAGFSEADAPAPEEILIRLLTNMRTPPGNLVMTAVHNLWPQLTIPPIETAGTVPGVKPTGVDVGELPPAVTGPGAPALPPVAVDDSPPPAVPPPAENPGPPAVTAAAAPNIEYRLSRQLLDIDKELRTRLHTAANAQMLRQLERAGAKLRTKVAKDETLRTKIAQRPNERVASIIGPQVIAAAGFSAADLLGGDWSPLKVQFNDWVQTAQGQALKLVSKLTGLMSTDPVIVTAQQAQQTARDQAWETLEQTLTDLSEKLLFEPDLNKAALDVDQVNPMTLVPAGAIRAALAIAGGAPVAQVTNTPLGGLAAPQGQIGTGQTVQSVMQTGGGTQHGFEWVHASSVLDPFEPHQELDGTVFDHFDDEALANQGDWPPVAYYLPGDHSGCTCDFMPLWATSN
jgi:hypothetical protein